MSPRDPVDDLSANAPETRRREARPAARAQPSGLRAALEAALRHMPAADLGRIARHLGLSKRTLQRALAREGVVFLALRTRIRLERAETLLAEPFNKVSAVAWDIGFCSTGHFIHWFRCHRGVTPGAWRTARAQSAPPPPDAGDA
jgi:AraC-like DNA-binding protein